MGERERGGGDVEVRSGVFGAWVGGTDWWGDREAGEAEARVTGAVDVGITYCERGDVYGHGDSERVLGAALADVRDEVVLATKVGYDFYNHPQAGHGELPKEISAAWIRAAVERSMQRLETDHIEVLQLHNADVDEVDADVLAELDALRDEGLVDAVGWALGPSIGWLAEGDMAITEAFDSVQLVWNIFEQDVGRHFLETLEATGSHTSLIPRVPHSSGLLNEQVTPATGHDLDDHRGYRPDAWYETGWEKLEQLRFLERDGARTMAQAAIAFLLSYDAVATVTPTFHSVADINAWAATPAVPPVTASERERVERLYDEAFGIDRFDGMDSLRSSVDGADIAAAGIDKRAVTRSRSAAR